MNSALFGIPNMDVYLVVGILIFFITLEVLGGYWHESRRTSADWIQEVGGYLVLALLIKPGIVLTVLFLGNTFSPTIQYFLNSQSLWLMLPLYLLVDDLLQYWYHRSAHEYDFLWKLHRPHHQAEEMGFFVSYRNAGLYYVMMPNIWWIGIFTFLGGATAIAIGLVLKQLVIISSHSRVHWDDFLYRHKMLHPLMTILERIFITPAFHHAHHGKTQRDGISDPNGNFGNMFSIWDQLFGTALYTRQFPEAYGIPNDPKEKWTAAYFYPLISAKDPQSELSRTFVKSDTTTLAPAIAQLEKGENYLWCQCGKSRSQPFCDGSHQGTRFKPVLFQVKKDGEFKLCNCKATKAGPFCDNSHMNVGQEAEEQITK